MFFKRDLSQKLKDFSKFPVIGLLGPRQSGKTTLVRHIFNNHNFVSLENLEDRQFASKDPKAFLATNENEHGLIIDEFQYVPQLLSYIQIIVDEKKRPGYFVLTGSQNFLMNSAITQSLAGRIGILTLLPLSIDELEKNKLLEDNSNEIIFKGCYPRLYSENFSPLNLYPSYIQTYIERDVRELTNVGDLRDFQKFMQLCAGRIGQLLNIADIATNCGISQKTANSWLSILEASYIIFLLRPYFNNFNKRITKSPKLYFYDTGIASSLLELRSSKDLYLSPFRGHLFENLIISDIYKQYYNLGIRPPVYFWRDQNGRIEIDCLLEMGIRRIPIEIKSGQTIVSDFFNSLDSWNEISKNDPANGYLIYGGELNQKRTAGNVVSWKKSGSLVNKIEEIT